ncbi:hypothetical protein BS47DRAFT_1298263 [Hydnum rufescens UP504]|uniref:Calpain catalytic domain-containing protein n=1 Tax=Hydnum rufescens UP504 TaxID=1448309 RepID=A0A9P6ATX2_9AGAM|nr:hypothetical protein BS47DRAFT_1298263 [Hydnum rufescens UP504]
MLKSILSGRFAVFPNSDSPSTDNPQLPSPKVQGESAKQPILVEFNQQKARAGLLVTNELEMAVERVKKNVAAIARECRLRNSKFRDIEFDLEEDREQCLHGLVTEPEERLNPADVRRISQTFSKPQFFVDGPNWSDVVQGDLGDCWLLSGLATVASMPELIKKICVARDEQVGVYGFTFQRDGVWTDVIVSSHRILFQPRYEELTLREKNLYHSDKDQYNKTARLGGKCLYFAKSGAEHETWVALLEKAYAKLHGDYASLKGGFSGEVIEDMTGGVSTLVHVNDILDADLFWKQELLMANEDRLFGCSIYDLKKDLNPAAATERVAHDYSILKAIEYRGKRFLRIRNPWGKSEWTGRWSDGSKEWTPEWLDALGALEHSFGDDGAFIMEYEDFLETWTLVQRSRLFDPSWIVSSLWINARVRGPLCAWDFGDISFTFNIPQASPVIVVLSQMNDRYYKAISAGYSEWTLDFKLYKKGDPELLARSSHSTFLCRSVNCELDLEAGDYVVHVRVDRQRLRPKNYFAVNMPLWDQRKLASVLSKSAMSGSIVASDFFFFSKLDMWLPRPIELFAGRDLHEIETKSLARLAAQRHSSAPIQAPVPAVPDDDPDALAIKMLSIGGAPSHPSPPVPAVRQHLRPASTCSPGSTCVPSVPGVPSALVVPPVPVVPLAPPVSPAPVPKSSTDINGVKEPDSKSAVDKPDVPIQVHGHGKGQEDLEAQNPTAVSEPLNIEIKVSQSPISLHRTLIHTS